jgi:hypothetical protein
VAGGPDLAITVTYCSRGYATVSSLPAKSTRMTPHNTHLHPISPEVIKQLAFRQLESNDYRMASEVRAREFDPDPTGTTRGKRCTITRPAPFAGSGRRNKQRGDLMSREAHYEDTIMKSHLLIAALPVMLLSANSAFAVETCVVAGHEGIMGTNMTAAFDVRAGQACISNINPHGTLFASEISQPAQHGIVRMVDKDTWVYAPVPGYHGPDSFAIMAQGQSIDETPGTSVLSYRVNVE